MKDNKYLVKSMTAAREDILLTEIFYQAFSGHKYVFPKSSITRGLRISSGKHNSK
jgi:hypothetical protein